MFYVLLTMFAGVGAGWLLRKWRPLRFSGKAVTLVIWLMLFLLGLEVGSNRDLAAGLSSLLCLALPEWRLPDCLAVGGGMGYYSLSSILISEYVEASLGSRLAAELGTIALLSNVFRELFTIVAAPFLARRFGPFAPIAAAGATAMDVALPAILRSSGERCLPAAVVSGVICDFSVPLLVTFFCSFG